jgi:hypothetical protein
VPRLGEREIGAFFYVHHISSDAEIERLVEPGRDLISPARLDRFGQIGTEKHDQKTNVNPEKEPDERSG